MKATWKGTRRRRIAAAERGLVPSVSPEPFASNPASEANSRERPEERTEPLVLCVLCVLCASAAPLVSCSASAGDHVFGNGSRSAVSGFDASVPSANSVPPVEFTNGPPVSSSTTWLSDSSPSASPLVAP